MAALIATALPFVHLNAPVSAARLWEPPNQLENSLPADRILQSSVTVLPRDSRTPLGSGVIVSSRKDRPLLIITAEHVAGQLPNRDGTVRIYNNGSPVSMGVRVFTMDPRSDLAILISTKNWKGPDVAARMPAAPPRRGDRILLAGTPAGHEWTLTSGIISNETACDHEVGACYRTDANIYFGQSGGGAFDTNGLLLGIADSLSVDYINCDSQEKHMVVVPGSGSIVNWWSLRAFLEKHDITAPLVLRDS